MFATGAAESPKHQQKPPRAVLQEIFWAKIIGALSALVMLSAFIFRFVLAMPGLHWVDLVFAVWLVWVLLYGPWLKRRWRKRLEAHDFALCLECGYDVRNAAANICPECGQAFSLSELSYRWDLWLGMEHVLRKRADRQAM